MLPTAPTLNNVIATGLLDNPNPLNLPYLASKMEGSRLNIKKFPGLVIRKTKPKGTIILFKTNRFLLVGLNSVEDCETLAKKVAKDIKKVINAQITLKSFRVTNLVASANLGFKVNVCSLAQEPYAYKDDKFAGVYLRTNQFKSALIFSSGKIVLNGFSEISKLQEGFEKIKSIVRQYAISATIIQKQKAKQPKAKEPKVQKLQYSQLKDSRNEEEEDDDEEEEHLCFDDQTNFK